MSAFIASKYLCNCFWKTSTIYIITFPLILCKNKKEKFSFFQNLFSWPILNLLNIPFNFVYVYISILTLSNFTSSSYVVYTHYKVFIIASPNRRLFSFDREKVSICEHMEFTYLKMKKPTEYLNMLRLVTI